MDTSKANCIRQVSNWSSIRNVHRFEQLTQFDKIQFQKDMEQASPKMIALFNKIKELDESDLARDKKLYKHMIFSDIKQLGYGAKIIASGFFAMGYSSYYNEQLRPIIPTTSNSNTFALLSSTLTYGKSFPVALRRQIVQEFNKRPDNIHGENIRFILLDSGYKEGLDLFDIKYIHVFEPSLTASDEKQVIGRGTRFCGQKGLTFHPSLGWPMQVYRYEVEIPDKVKFLFGESHLFPLFLKYSGIDIRKVLFANNLEQTAITGAVDRMLTKNIHHFQIKDEDIDMELFKQIFGVNSSTQTPSQGGSKKNKKKKEKQLYAKPPQRFYSFPSLRTYIQQRYKKYTWPVVKMENLCTSTTSNGGSIPAKGHMIHFTPTQDFVRMYFQSSSVYKGLLAWHSVGTGKTCTAIATASTSFERDGYSILWVTRHTLKPDIWKNMFDQICSTVLRNEWKKGNRWPEQIDAPMRYVSDQWLPPISYKQFSNLLKGKNKIYDEMVKRNGSEDPLRKTLVIIDEAHKLYASDLPKQERPDVSILKQMVHHSYDVSGKDSVRLLLMTATPYTSEPMDLIRLLNLLRSPDTALPEDFEEFSKTYLNDRGDFTVKTKYQFLNAIAGYISYLNREKDARQFAYPVFENITVPLSLDASKITAIELKELEHDLETHKSNQEEQKKVKQEIKQKIKTELETALQELCKDKKPKKPCQDYVKQQVYQKRDTLLMELGQRMEEKERQIQSTKQKVTIKKQTLRDQQKTDLSQEKALLEKCHLQSKSKQKSKKTNQEQNQYDIDNGTASNYPSVIQTGLNSSLR
jgi:hypothetical protein